MPLREVSWDGNRNRAVILDLHDLTVELRKATEEAKSIQIQVDFMLSIGELALLLTVGEGNRSHVLFAHGTLGEGSQRFEYVLDGCEEDPAHAFLYGGSYSEVDFNCTVPYEAAVSALKEFFVAGARPDSLPWDVPS